MLDKPTNVAHNGRPYLAFTIGGWTGRIPARYKDVPRDVLPRLVVG